MARPLTLAAALAISLLPVAGAGDAATQQTPKRGGTVAVPFGGPEPACLNPFASCDFGVAQGNAVLGSVFEGAFRIGPDLRYVPSLVSGAEIVSRKPLTVVYRIRPEARWSDRTPVTASDFAFTHRVFSANATSAPGVDLRPAYRTIRRVVRVDAKTVRVVFRKPYADWRLLFAPVLPSHVLEGEDMTAIWRTSIENPRTGRPIGSGPFLVGSWERGKQITLVRNPRYWGAHPAYLDALVARFPNPAVRTPVEAFRGGHRDLLGLPGADPSAIAELRGVSGVTVRTSPAVGLEYLLFRLGPGGHPALRDRLVRQALAHGLDRSALARVRTGDARLKSDSAVLARVSRFYRPTWALYTFDPRRARLLLERAGCQRGSDGIYACGGERLSLAFVTTGGNPPRERTLELIQAQLLRSGIEVRPLYAPNIVVLIESVLRTGQFDAALVFVSGSSARIAGPYCGGGDENWTGYCNRLTNRDLLDADASMDERQQARVLWRADAKLARHVPVIPLTSLQYMLAYRSNIRGIVPNPVDPLWGREDWWLDD